MEEIKEQEAKEEAEEDDYDYELFTIEPKTKKADVIDQNEIMVITKSAKERNMEVQDMFEMAVKGPTMAGGGWQGDFGNLLAQADSVLVEFIHISNPDETVEELLKIKIPQLLVSVCPKDSYKYVVKRLSFEGNFQVLTLGNPTLEDYSDYGKRFMQYFKYSIEEIDFLEVVRDLASYRGNLMKEADVYQHLRNAFEKADRRGEKVLRKADLKMDYYGQEDPKEELDSMIGLEKAKKMLFRYMAAKKVMKGDNAYKHLIQHILLFSVVSPTLLLSRTSKL